MTRAEAIELLVNATYSEEWQGNEQLAKAQHMAIDALEQEPAWIPVSERLPEDYMPVLIYAWNVHHVVARRFRHRNEDGTYKEVWVTADAWNGNTEIKNEVIAWMPLPEPYVESEEEQMASEMRDYCERYEPTYNSEDGSM